MDGENLDLNDESFDVVMSRVGLIYFPDRQKALDAGFFEHVAKPFEFERLADLIESGDGETAARPATAAKRCSADFSERGL